MGEDDEGTAGGEAEGHGGYAAVDCGVEVEGAWKGVEEVAKCEGEVGGSWGLGICISTCIENIVGIASHFKSEFYEAGLSLNIKAYRFNV